MLSSKIPQEEVSEVSLSGREVLRWVEPEHEEYLQGMVDEDRQVGRFILTGSQQFGGRVLRL